jgi:hypothetical protein
MSTMLDRHSDLDAEVGGRARPASAGADQFPHPKDDRPAPRTDTTNPIEASTPCPG